MKRAFFVPLIFLLLIGCTSTFSRTGFKTFMVTGNVEKETKAKECLKRDASRLCGGEYLILGEKTIHYPKVFHDDTENWRYIFEVECLGTVDEHFYELNREQQPVYIIY